METTLKNNGPTLVPPAMTERVRFLEECKESTWFRFSSSYLLFVKQTAAYKEDLHNYIMREGFRERLCVLAKVTQCLRGRAGSPA